MKKLILSLLIAFIATASYSQDKPKATYQDGNAKITAWEKDGVKTFKVENTRKGSNNQFEGKELFDLHRTLLNAMNGEKMFDVNDKQIETLKNALKEADKKENPDKKKLD